MTSVNSTTQAQEFTAADLDRLMAHYVHAAKELRATTLRSIFTSAFSSKPKNNDRSINLPGAAVGNA